MPDAVTCKSQPSLFEIKIIKNITEFARKKSFKFHIFVLKIMLKESQCFTQFGMKFETRDPLDTQNLKDRVLEI